MVLLYAIKRQKYYDYKSKAKNFYGSCDLSAGDDFANPASFQKLFFLTIEKYRTIKTMRWCPGPESNRHEGFSLEGF